MADWWQTFFGDSAYRLQETDPQYTAEQVDFLEQVMELPPGGAVLDVACGRGRHSLLLAERGYRVTGLDYSQDYLEDARQKAVEQGLEVRFLRGDMREMTFARQFDGAISMFTALGYFETDEDDLRILQGVSRALKPGGRYLIDTVNRDAILRGFQPKHWVDEGDGFLLQERSFDVKTGRNLDSWTFLRDGQRATFHLTLRFYTYTEMAWLLRQAGLEVAACWGGFDGSELALDSRRMVVMAQKPPSPR